MQSSQSWISLISHDRSTLIIAGIVSLIILVAISKCSHHINLSNRSPEHRIITEQQAIEIYKRKLEFMKSIRTESGRTRTARIKNKCVELGRQYRVSPKTIWDVWNRKTWVVATSSLWAGE